MSVSAVPGPASDPFLGSATVDLPPSHNPIFTFAVTLPRRWAIASSLGVGNLPGLGRTTVGRGHRPVPLLLSHHRDLALQKQWFGDIFLPDYGRKYVLTPGLTDWLDPNFYKSTHFLRVLSYLCFNNIKSLESAHFNSRALS